MPHVFSITTILPQFGCRKNPLATVGCLICNGSKQSKVHCNEINKKLWNPHGIVPNGIWHCGFGPQLVTRGWLLHSEAKWASRGDHFAVCQTRPIRTGRVGAFLKGNEHLDRVRKSTFSHLQIGIFPTLYRYKAIIHGFCYILYYTTLEERKK